MSSNSPAGAIAEFISPGHLKDFSMAFSSFSDRRRRMILNQLEEVTLSSCDKNKTILENGPAWISRDFHNQMYSAFGLRESNTPVEDFMHSA